MLININQIKVTDRIRKDFGDIQELADDIKENGLINPPVVTPDTFELIAGERRLRALKELGYQQIEVRVMSIKDAEHQLNLEISENETRKDFSKKERIDYARRLEKIEQVKAKERQRIGIKSETYINDKFFECEKGETIDIVASKLGIGSGEQLRKEKYIVDNADSCTLAQWDKQDISTHKAYTKIKNKSRIPIPSLTIKHLINRTNGKCEICDWGGLGLEGVLLPHHINKYSITQNNNVDEIIMICPNCHGIIHTLENCKDDGMVNKITDNINIEIKDKILKYVYILNNKGDINYATD